MQTSLKELETQALGLSADERAKLAETMLASLSAPINEIEDAWAQEIEQRVKAFDRDEIQWFTAEEVFADAKRI
ncbi:addiction module antitoxin RelB [Kineobactrum sediminis]|uniref:Addiction module antitoxin RelB n=1 Tax=Kineobactrum sediminis TaxID=1905677 RepID=A0A2N5XXW1_9GAMM|nr:addiction module protein [Kineobactrum sediminis]PLW80986.1 addiction module antitoxin RelB [Kineobactrum sediminis]